MQDKVFYFGFGANRDARMLSAIIGKPVEEFVGQAAVLDGYALAIQSLERIPDSISPTAPLPVSPQQLIRQNWSQDFRSYVITPQAGAQVSGTVWELTQDERSRIRDWELLDFGWQTDCIGIVKLEDGTEVSVATERIGDGQEIDCLVDGLQYETWLHHPEEFKLVAEKIRNLYNERLFGPEGATGSDINKS